MQFIQPNIKTILSFGSSKCCNTKQKLTCKTVIKRQHYMCNIQVSLHCTLAHGHNMIHSTM